MPCPLDQGNISLLDYHFIHHEEANYFPTDTTFISSSHTYSSEHFWKPAKDGDKIILIRHALAPGGGDPEGFNIKDCRTQRNLNEIGINQSKKIGKLFEEKKLRLIKFYQVSGVGARHC